MWIVYFIYVCLPVRHRQCKRRRLKNSLRRFCCVRHFIYFIPNNGNAAYTSFYNIIPESFLTVPLRRATFCIGILLSFIIKQCLRKTNSSFNFQLYIFLNILSLLRITKRSRAKEVQRTYLAISYLLQIIPTTMMKKGSMQKR